MTPAAPELLEWFGAEASNPTMDTRGSDSRLLAGWGLTAVAEGHHSSDNTLAPGLAGEDTIRGRGMKIGYFLSSEEAQPADLVKQAKLAEQAGFDALWISDHYHHGLCPCWSSCGRSSEHCRK
jgi:hypothetical protein